MRVAAFQGPYLPFGSGDVVELIEGQLEQCEREDIDLLCCPEALLGGLPYELDGQSPSDVAVSVKELHPHLAPVMSSPVASVVGFNERGDTGSLYSSAVFLADGAIRAV